MTENGRGLLGTRRAPAVGESGLCGPGVGPLDPVGRGPERPPGGFYHPRRDPYHDVGEEDERQRKRRRCGDRTEEGRGDERHQAQPAGDEQDGAAYDEAARS
jgi:hypothetical protein